MSQALLNALLPILAQLEPIIANELLRLVQNAIPPAK